MCTKIKDAADENFETKNSDLSKEKDHTKTLGKKQDSRSTSF